MRRGVSIAAHLLFTRRITTTFPIEIDKTHAVTNLERDRASRILFAWFF